MEPKAVEELLIECVEESEFPAADESFDVVPFSETDILTNDAGFEIAFEDGSTFQVTIVRSR